jgi:hypothetical protein
LGILKSTRKTNHHKYRYSANQTRVFVIGSNQRKVRGCVTDSNSADLVGGILLAGQIYSRSFATCADFGDLPSL